MPTFVKVLAFWKALAYVIAALVLFFAPQYALTDGVLLGLFLAVLQLFGIAPELRARGLK